MEKPDVGRFGALRASVRLLSGFPFSESQVAQPLI